MKRSPAANRSWTLLSIFFLAVIVAGVTLHPRYHRGRPHAPVEIVRDAWGTPHVRAADRHDLFFGQGYATAADRIFQMDWSRRQLLGKRAEVTGRTDIVADFQMRALRLERVARDIYAALPPGDREAVDAYAAGVNEWLRTHTLPREFRRLDFRPDPWRPWDCLVVWRGMALTLTDLTDDLSDTVSSGGEGESRSGRPERTGLGSNAWAVAGERTRSGHPLLAGDPHLGFAVPGPLCRVALADSQAAATGFAIAGVPGIVMGRTRTAAWTPTAFEGDDSDIFSFETDPQKPSRYRTASGWRTIGRFRPVVWLKVWHSVTVPVFWQAIERTEWGPVIRRDHGRMLVLRWAGDEALPGEGVVTARTVDARSVGDIGRLLAGLGLPDINIVAADSAGGIAHFIAGRLPRRVRHRGPRSGADSTLAWHGFIPFSALPRSIDPPDGFVVSANGPPPPGPDYLGRDWPEQRERRIRFLLASAESVGVEDFRRIQLDHLVPGAREDVARRLGSLGGSPLSDRARDAAAMLVRWDGRAEVDSAAPAIYRAWQDLGTGPAGLEAACAWLARRLGPNPAEWRWGRIHEARLRHPLAASDSTLGIGLFPRAGDRGTIDVGGYAVFDTSRTPPALSLHGPAARMIADLSPGGKTWGILLAGQSGDPDNPHLSDQFDLWRRGELVEFTPPGERPSPPVSTEWLGRHPAGDVTAKP